MSKLPDVLGALIADGLGAIGVPGASSAGEAVKGYLQRSSDAARVILLDEFRRGNIDAANVAAEDDRVSVVYRYLRASWEGSARVNLRLLAKAIVGRIKTNSLVADEFLPHADALAALSRDEIILLATMYGVQSCLEDPPSIDDALRIDEIAQRKNELWEETEQKLEAIGWSKDRIQAAGNRALRSGYVLAGSGWDGVLSFRPSPLLIDLCKTVDFTDALRREGDGTPAN